MTLFYIQMRCEHEFTTECYNATGKNPEAMTIMIQSRAKRMVKEALEENWKRINKMLTCPACVKFKEQNK